MMASLNTRHWLYQPEKNFVRHSRQSPLDTCFTPHGHVELNIPQFLNFWPKFSHSLIFVINQLKLPQWYLSSSCLPSPTLFRGFILQKLKKLKITEILWRLSTILSIIVNSSQFMLWCFDACIRICMKPSPFSNQFTLVHTFLTVAAK